MQDSVKVAGGILWTATTSEQWKVTLPMWKGDLGTC